MPTALPGNGASWERLCPAREWDGKTATCRRARDACVRRTRRSQDVRVRHRTLASPLSFDRTGAHPREPVPQRETILPAYPTVLARWPPIRSRWRAVPRSRPPRSGTDDVPAPRSATRPAPRSLLRLQAGQAIPGVPARREEALPPALPHRPPARPSASCGPPPQRLDALAAKPGETLGPGPGASAAAEPFRQVLARTNPERHGERTRERSMSDGVRGAGDDERTIHGRTGGWGAHPVTGRRAPAGTDRPRQRLGAGCSTPRREVRMNGARAPARAMTAPMTCVRQVLALSHYNHARSVGRRLRCEMPQNRPPSSAAGRPYRRRDGRRRRRRDFRQAEFRQARTVLVNACNRTGFWAPRATRPRTSPDEPTN